MRFDGTSDRIVFDISFNNDDDNLYFDGREFRLFDVRVQKLVKPGSSEHYCDLFDAYYQGRGLTRRLYSIYLYEGPLSLHNSYHKPKYAGIYIDDGKYNIRVSKVYRELGPSFWFEDERYVIAGAYVYDTSGTLLERQIVDEGGTILGLCGSAKPVSMGGYVP